jgi:uncharacterized protein (UPF0548 family)
MAFEGLPVWFLDPRVDLEKYATAELTYAVRGATRATLPPGYRHLSRRERIGTGPATFRRAVEALNGWHMHRSAGLAIVSATPTADVGSVTVMRPGLPVVGVVLPCRVVYVVNEPGRRGLAYGTLPGQPEQGEEAFVVELSTDGQVHLVIRAFSRPATLLARAGGPLTRAIQSLITDRYVRALRTKSVGPPFMNPRPTALLRSGPIAPPPGRHPHVKHDRVPRGRSSRRSCRRGRRVIQRLLVATRVPLARSYGVRPLPMNNDPT